MDTSADVAARFRANGFKLTPQRYAIFAALDGNSTHPTAEAVHAEVIKTLPMVSLRTVYQTLNEMISLGEIAAFDFGGKSSRFDPNTAAHHHLVCESCDVVFDVYPDAVAELDAESAHGFAVTAVEVIFRGTCPACRLAATDVVPQN